MKGSGNNNKRNEKEPGQTRNEDVMQTGDLVKGEKHLHVGRAEAHRLALVMTAGTTWSRRDGTGLGVQSGGPLMGFLIMEASSPVDGVCEGTTLSGGGREGVSFRGTGGGRSEVSFGGTSGAGGAGGGGAAVKGLVLETLTAVLDAG